MTRRLLLAALLCAAPALATASDGFVLRVGTSGDYAPFALDGEGFDVEVARLVARELGARIEWVPFRWPGLAADVAADRFDVAMSGVTWRPERAVVGRMSRAVASGGPCVLGSAAPARVGVNRGGILEVWTRTRFRDAQVVAVDENASLPGRLARGEVDAIVTDSFELSHFRRGDEAVACEPALDRKVYWVAPGAVAALAPALDRVLREREPEIRRLRADYLDGAAPRDEIDHLVDLLARRLALMPAVAAWKRAHGRPVEDRAREARVLADVAAGARERGIEVASSRRLFELQMELAKAVQRRAPDDAAPLDLESALRPALGALGGRILDALARVTPVTPADLPNARMLPLRALLEPGELESLRAALLLVRPAAAPNPRVTKEHRQPHH